MPKILRSGRLGNQLFHYAYAYWILSSGESDLDYQVKLLVKSNDEEKLNFLRGSCKHIELATLTKEKVLNYGYIPNWILNLGN
jgi:hypothetical protein